MSGTPARLGQTTVEVIRFIKAQLSSSAATAVDWLVVTTLVIMVGHPFYVHAVVAGAIAGAVTDFSIKRWWVFTTPATRPQPPVHNEVLRYAVVSGLSAVLNGAFVYALVDWLHLQLKIAVPLASLLIGFAWNYPLHRLYVFAPPAVPSEKP
jgi:putative flippase GtrA